MATPRSNFVKLRLTDLEKADWQKAAGGARLLSEWIRRTCNAAAENSRLDSTDLTHNAIGGLVPNEKPLIVQAAMKDQAHRESRPLPAAEALSDDSSSGDRNVSSGGGESCPRWMHHRSGVYCGACKKVQPK